MWLTHAWTTTLHSAVAFRQCAAHLLAVHMPAPIEKPPCTPHQHHCLEAAAGRVSTSARVPGVATSNPDVGSAPFRPVQVKDRIMGIGIARPGGIQVPGVAGLHSAGRFEELCGSRLHRPNQHILTSNGQSLQVGPLADSRLYRLDLYMLTCLAQQTPQVRSHRQQAMISSL